MIKVVRLQSLKLYWGYYEQSHVLCCSSIGATVKCRGKLRFKLIPYHNSFSFLNTQIEANRSLAVLIADIYPFSLSFHRPAFPFPLSTSSFLPLSYCLYHTPHILLPDPPSISSPFTRSLWFNPHSSFNLNLLSPVSVIILAFPCGPQHSWASMPSNLCHHLHWVPVWCLTDSTSWRWALLKIFQKRSSFSWVRAWKSERILVCKKEEYKTKRRQFVLFYFLSLSIFGSLTFHLALFYLILFLDIPRGSSWTFQTNTPYIRLEVCHHSSHYSPLALHPDSYLLLL